jgi:hypothetical protein
MPDRPLADIRGLEQLPSGGVADLFGGGAVKDKGSQQEMPTFAGRPEREKQTCWMS